MKMTGEEGAAKGGNERKQDEKGSLAERCNRTEQDFLVTERRGSEEAKKTANSLKQDRDSTETEKEKDETQPQALKRKRALNITAAETQDNRGLTAGESTNDRTEPKRLSTCDRKPEKVSSEGAGSDIVALGPSSVQRKERPQLTREAEGQKPLGNLPSANSPQNQTQGKVLHGSLQVVDDTSSPRRPPSNPPPPLSAALKQADVSLSQQKPLSQQPPAAQCRAQNQHPHPKPHAPFLQTHSNMQQQLNPLPQNQTVSAQEAHGQEEGKVPFSFTFSRLYSLKGLKDKVSKLPTQSKRSSTSSPPKGHKSTS